MGIPFEQRNFQKELDKKIAGFQKDGIVPTLLLHSCCAPCSSHCIEYLSDYFHITVFYYNPNISAEEEYRKRVEEQKRFISEFPAKYKVSFIEGDYDTKEFYDIAKGYEQCREGGERCFRCYELRLKKTCETAKAGGFDYFTTTLTISPLKNSVRLNEIGLSFQRNMICHIFYLILRKKRDISVLLSFHMSIIYTGRIIADVSIRVDFCTISMIY